MFYIDILVDVIKTKYPFAEHQLFALEGRIAAGFFFFTV